MNRFAVSGLLALVTGATRGIGLGVSRALAASGAGLILTGRDEAELGSVNETLSKCGCGEDNSAQCRVEKQSNCHMLSVRVCGQAGDCPKLARTMLWFESSKETLSGDKLIDFHQWKMEQ